MKTTPIMLLAFFLLTGCTSTPTPAPQQDTPTTQEHQPPAPAPAPPKPTPLEQAEALHARCSPDDTDACIAAGKMYYYSDHLDEIYWDSERAHKLFELACNANNPEACYLLGKMHADRGGISQDHDRLANRECIGGGEVDVCSPTTSKRDNFPYADVPDNAHAIQLFQKACTAGNPQACQHLQILTHPQHTP